MAALAQTPLAPPRVRSIVQHDFHLFSSSFLTNPTNFTKLSTEFRATVSTGGEQVSFRSLENDLADAGIVVRMADKDHAEPIFPVKLDKQSIDPQLFAVYQVARPAAINLAVTPCC
jgi:hypothetical protein